MLRAHVFSPPARRARRAAVVLSGIAALCSLAFGFEARAAYHLYTGAQEPTDDVMRLVLFALVALLFAFVFRIAAGVCELLWLERTWSNLAHDLRKVGPLDDVSSGMLIGLSFVPGVAWLWKLGLIVGVTRGFEAMRARYPFRAPVPKHLGVVSAVLGWLPPLNVYVAPFLWEMFAARIEIVIAELLESARAGREAAAPTTTTSGSGPAFTPFQAASEPATAPVTTAPPAG